jgi:hypothetical protein
MEAWLSWLKAPHSKCGMRVTASRVRISPLPQNFQTHFCAIIKDFLLTIYSINFLRGKYFEHRHDISL